MSIQQRIAVLSAVDNAAKQKQLMYLDMKDAVQKYGNWHAADINRALRSGSELPPELKRLVEYLDTAFATKGVHNITKKPLWAYRGIGYGRKEDVPKLRKGVTFTDKAYSSCSMSDRIANSAINDVGLLYEIRLPAGTKYLPGRGDEAEILLDRGSRFKIRSYIPSESNKDFEDRYIMQVTMDYLGTK